MDSNAPLETKGNTGGFRGICSGIGHTPTCSGSGSKHRRHRNLPSTAYNYTGDLPGTIVGGPTVASGRPLCGSPYNNCSSHFMTAHGSGGSGRSGHGNSTSLRAKPRETSAPPCNAPPPKLLRQFFNNGERVTDLPIKLFGTKVGKGGSENAVCSFGSNPPGVRRSHGLGSAYDIAGSSLFTVARPSLGLTASQQVSLIPTRYCHGLHDRQYSIDQHEDGPKEFQGRHQPIHLQAHSSQPQQESQPYHRPMAAVTAVTASGHYRYASPPQPTSRPQLCTLGMPERLSGRDGTLQCHSPVHSFLPPAPSPPSSPAASSSPAKQLRRQQQRRLLPAGTSLPASADRYQPQPCGGHPTTATRQAPNRQQPSAHYQYADTAVTPSHPSGGTQSKFPEQSGLVLRHDKLSQVPCDKSSSIDAGQVLWSLSQPSPLYPPQEPQPQPPIHVPIALPYMNLDPVSEDGPFCGVQQRPSPLLNFAQSVASSAWLQQPPAVAAQQQPQHFDIDTARVPAAPRADLVAATAFPTGDTVASVDYWQRPATESSVAGTPIVVRHNFVDSTHVRDDGSYYRQASPPAVAVSSAEQVGWQALTPTPSVLRRQQHLIVAVDDSTPTDRSQSSYRAVVVPTSQSFRRCKDVSEPAQTPIIVTGQWPSGGSRDYDISSMAGMIHCQQQSPKGKEISATRPLSPHTTDVEPAVAHPSPLTSGLDVSVGCFQGSASVAEVKSEVCTRENTRQSMSPPTVTTEGNSKHRTHTLEDHHSSAVRTPSSPSSHIPITGLSGLSISSPSIVTPYQYEARVHPILSSQEDSESLGPTQSPGVGSRPTAHDDRMPLTSSSAARPRVPQGLGLNFSALSQRHRHPSSPDTVQAAATLTTLTCSPLSPTIPSAASATTTAAFPIRPQPHSPTPRALRNHTPQGRRLRRPPNDANMTPPLRPQTSPPPPLGVKLDSELGGESPTSTPPAQRKQAAQSSQRSLSTSRTRRKCHNSTEESAVSLSPELHPRRNELRPADHTVEVAQPRMPRELKQKTRGRSVTRGATARRQTRSLSREVGTQADWIPEFNSSGTSSSSNAQLVLEVPNTLVYVGPGWHISPGHDDCPSTPDSHYPGQRDVPSTDIDARRSPQAPLPAPLVNMSIGKSLREAVVIPSVLPELLGRTEDAQAGLVSSESSLSPPTSVGGGSPVNSRKYCCCEGCIFHGPNTSVIERPSQPARGSQGNPSTFTTRNTAVSYQRMTTAGDDPPVGGAAERLPDPLTASGQAGDQAVKTLSHKTTARLPTMEAKVYSESASSVDSSQVGDDREDQSGPPRAEILRPQCFMVPHPGPGRTRTHPPPVERYILSTRTQSRFDKTGGGAYQGFYHSDLDGAPASESSSLGHSIVPPLDLSSLEAASSLDLLKADARPAGGYHIVQAVVANNAVDEEPERMIQPRQEHQRHAEARVQPDRSGLDFDVSAPHNSQHTPMDVRTSPTPELLATDLRESLTLAKAVITPPPLSTEQELTERLRSALSEVSSRRFSLLQQETGRSTARGSRTPRVVSQVFTKAGLTSPSSPATEDGGLTSRRDSVTVVIHSPPSPPPETETTSMEASGLEGRQERTGGLPALSSEISSLSQLGPPAPSSVEPRPLGVPARSTGAPGVIASAHVILLDADDTLIPTSELCEEKYLDREMHELPPEFQHQLTLLDDQLTQLFEQLHSMVVLEQAGVTTEGSSSPNYVLSVVIITNATLSHIQATFEKFLPKLTGFFERRRIKIDDLVCSARDVWGDEFPFEHFYEFWKAWTLEDILRELKSDGVPNVTVLSIGDDEPERKAAAYVELEMDGFVNTVKVVKMVGQPKIKQLITQLKYINQHVRRYVQTPKAFDCKLEIVSSTEDPENGGFSAQDEIVTESPQTAPPEIPDRVEALFIQFELKYEVLFEAFRHMARQDILRFVLALRSIRSRQAADLATFIEEAKGFLSMYAAVSGKGPLSPPPLQDLIYSFPVEPLMSFNIRQQNSARAPVINGDETDRGGDSDSTESMLTDRHHAHDYPTVLAALQTVVKFLMQYSNMMATLPTLDWYALNPSTGGSAGVVDGGGGPASTVDDNEPRAVDSAGNCALSHPPGGGDFLLTAVYIFLAALESPDEVIAKLRVGPDPVTLPQIVSTGGRLEGGADLNTSPSLTPTAVTVGGGIGVAAVDDVER